jgi:hypothetical protein
VSKGEDGNRENHGRKFRLFDLVVKVDVKNNNVCG